MGRWRTYSSVAVPEINVHLRDRLTSAGVNELDVKVKGHAFLALGDVAADELASDICSRR